MKYKKPAAFTALTLLVAAGLAFVATRQTTVEAADHLDPPMRTGDALGAARDVEADIADVYAWYRDLGAGADRTAVLAMSFAGPNAPVAGQETPCDRDVVYSILIDNNETDGFAPTSTIEMRFGEDSEGNCFYQMTGVPGAGTDPLVGAVGFETRRDDVQAYVGLRADAFFFDLEGFRTTLSSGTLSFLNDRDFFAGKNTSVMVVEVPLVAVSPTDAPYRVWGTTARFGG